MADKNLMHVPALELQARFAQWSELDRERNEFIQRLLYRLSLNEDEISQLKLDFEDQKRSRVHYQSESLRLEGELQDHEYRINRDAYVAILVDGDGAKFRDSLLRDPVSGAAEAARNLQQQVREHLRGTSLDNEDVPILARAFANIKGLGTALRLSSVIPSDDNMYAFAENFTNSRADFDFVNVGRGKENADSKIRRMLSHFYKDPRCKKIFFVACHDGGYAHDLRQYMGPPGIEKRIILVETTPAEASLRSLGFSIVRFDDVFRDEPLQNESKIALRSKPVNSMPGQGFVPTPRENPTPSVAPTAPAQSSIVNIASSRESTPSTTSTRSTGSTPDSRPDSPGHPLSYSTACATNGPRNVTIKPAKPGRQPVTIDYNAEGHRLDPPVKIPTSRAAQDSYRRKCDKIFPGVFCNSFYLGGVCPRRESCDKQHELALTAEEVGIHRFKARTSVCYLGPECDKYHCHLSHHCPQDPNCTRPSCKFIKTKWGNLHLSKKEMEPETRWTEGCDYPEDLAE